MRTFNLRLVLTLLAALASIALHASAEDAGTSSGGATSSPTDDQTIATTTNISTTTTTTSGSTITPEQKSTTTPKPSTTSTTTTTKKPKPFVLNDCPTTCSCDGRRVDCDNANLKSLPNLSKTSFVEFSFKNNPAITSVNLNSFPFSTELIDLSKNEFKIIERASKRSLDGFPKLKTFNLTQGQLDSIANLTMWRMPQLSVLDLSYNPIKEINQPILFKSLKTLRMDGLVLTSLNDTVFNMLNDLEVLSLSKSIAKMSSVQLPNQIFSKNQKLKVLDLSFNNLVDVPVALRSVNSVEELCLDGNFMTSLRPSDLINKSALVKLELSQCPYLTEIDDYAFENMPNLKKLILSSNPRLREISREAFVSKQTSEDSSEEVNNNKILHELDLIDLSGNNFTTLHDPTKFKSISFKQILLNDNPWNCDCNLAWLSSMPASLSSTMHCKTPALYRDIEVSQFIKTVECDERELNYQKIVLVSFLIFLLVLTIAVFAQKADLCRRFQMRDQYGTIYYTKASFPTEAV